MVYGPSLDDGSGIKAVEVFPADDKVDGKVTPLDE
jgi:hypothetical protein